MIKTIAVDDEPLALVVVESFCQRMDVIDLRGTFTEPAEAIKYLSENQVDLIFLDVKMPAMSGLEFARYTDKEVMVIFTTAYTEYAVEGFNLNAIDYLLKPFAFDRFEQAVIKAKDLFEYRTDSNTNDPSYILLRVDYSLRKIYIDNIRYIEGLDNNLKIVLKNGDPIVVRMSMKAMEEKLPADVFIRVHRSLSSR
ncbi:MAG: response regulator transcription factor [Sphingobacteriales bacterium]|nr:MAG: response regulator transcription factor [Sphingobacteriales bacterium]